MKQQNIGFLAVALFGTGLACGICFSGGFADARPALDKDLNIIEDSQRGIIKLAEQVIPTVVNISPVSEDSFSHSSRHPSEKSEEGGAKPPPGSGSGVIIDKKGFIVTNNHVVGDAEEMEVRLSDKSKFTGKVIGKDPDTDLALVKIDSEKDFPFVPLADSKKVKVGQWVMAVGNPFGLDRTVTVGIVSGLGRENINLSRYEDFIQTDASINPGNSGGPLFNVQGEVIGINTAIINIAQGIGFAIPSNMVQAVISQLMNGGKVTRGWLGVGIQPLTSELATKFGAKESDGAAPLSGVLVNEVFEGDPAFMGGILPGDIILKVDDEPVDTTNRLARVIAGFSPGQKIKIELIRNGKKQQLTMALGEKKSDATQASISKQEAPRPFFGLTVLDLTPENIEKFKLQENKGGTIPSGVVVSGVESDSPAFAEGLKEGDIIKEMEGETVSNVESFEKITKKAEKTETLLLRVSRENRSFFVVLKQKEQ
ncbi:MAG: Do family serine endopeptidase [Nitrospirae bacterium]|nr:Do family serine endopeptidase [Candidatus Troglogloeales bacterium]